MRRFTLSIQCDNDAFCVDPGMEIARILRDLADRIVETGLDDVEVWSLYDTNGNRVGRSEYSVESE